MAITVTNLGTGSNKTSSQISFTAASAAAIGTVIVVAVCDGGTSSTNLPSDTQNNTYASIATTFNNSTGTANGFTTLYYAVVTTALSTSDSIRYTPTSSAGAAVTAFFLTGVSGSIPYQVASANTGRGSSTLPQATTTVAQVMPGTCVVGVVGVNDPSTDSFTQDTTHATFTTPPIRVGTTGNPAASNWIIAGGSVVRTGTTETALIYGPTITTAKWGAIVVAFQPQILNGVSGTSGVGSLTGSYSRSISITGVSAFGLPVADYVRNPTASGAVAGTLGSGGSNPTNWSVDSSPAYMTHTVVGTGTESGIPYIDYSVSGTVTDPGPILCLNLTPDQAYYVGASIAASQGQTWTVAYYLRLISGSLPANVGLIITEIDNSGTQLAYDGANVGPPTTAALSGQRYSQTFTLGQATTTNILPAIWFYATNGQVVSFTIRIGQPSLTRTASVAPTSSPVTPQVGGVISSVVAEGAVQSWGTNLLDYSMAGGSAPSTLPTGWFGFGNLSGLTSTYAYGTENGIAYIDWRLSGTSTASPSSEVGLAFSPGFAGPVSVGQTWVLDYFAKQVGGTTTNVDSFRVHIDEKDSLGNYLIGDTNVYPPPFPTTQLGTFTASYSRTLTNSSVAALTPYASILFLSGPVDITLRIGKPMLSQATLAGGTFKRASSATYIDSSGQKMVLVGNDVLRTDYSTVTPLNVTSIGSNTGKGVSSIVITLPAAVPAGCTIFVAVASAGSSILTNVADSVGQSNWVGGNGAATANGTIILDWAWNATAMPASSTITVTRSGGGTFTGAVYAWWVTGLLTSTSPLDTAQTNLGSGTSVSLTTGTLSQIADYVVGALAVAGPGTETFTNDSNFSLLPSYRVGTTGGSDITVDVGMRTTLSTAGVTYAPTLGTSENWAAYLATFKQTGWGRVLIEGASTNLVPNANTGNPTWNATLSSPPAITPLYAAASLWKLTSPGGSFNYAAFVTIPVTTNQIYTCSAWIYLPVGFNDVPIEIDFDYAFPGATTLPNSNYITNLSLTGQWQRIWRTVLTAPGTDPAMNVVLRPSGSSTAGAISYFQMFQVEPGTLTSYIPTTGSAASRAIEYSSPTGLEIVGKVITGVSSTSSAAGSLSKTVSPGFSGVSAVGQLAGSPGAESLSFNFLSGALDPSLTFTRATSAYLFDYTGNLTTVASGVPRFEYDPTLVFNYITNSQTVGGTGWTTSLVTVTPNATTAPDGTNTAVLITDNTTNGQHLAFAQPTCAPTLVGQTYTGSVYAKAGTSTTVQTTLWGESASPTFDLAAGTASAGATITSVGNGWYRCSYTWTRTTNSFDAFYVAPVNVGVYTGTGSGAYFWGAQLEIGGTLGSYVPTNGVTASSSATIRGLLVEEARTNSIRNPRAEGAVAGSPGTAPTNWAGWGNQAGLTQTIVGTGYEQGIPYVDVRYNGTTTGTSFFPAFETTTGVSASNGQTWTISVYFRLIAGSWTNVTGVYLNWQELDNTQSFLVSHGQQITNPTNSALATQRQTATFTNTQASCASVYPQWGVTLTTSAAVDFTLRIGAPQMEQGSCFTSPILPPIGSPAATTRNADVVSIATSTWYNSAASTLAAEAMFLYATSPSLTYSGIVEIDDGTVNNRFQLFVLPGTTQVYFGDNYTSNLNDINFQVGTATTGQVFRVAGAINSSTAAASLNGGTVVTATPAHFPGASLNRLLIGAVAGGNWFNGYLRKVRYWNSLLSNQALQLITTETPIPQISETTSGIAGVSGVGTAVGLPQTDGTGSVLGVQGYGAPENFVRNPTGTGLVAGTLGSGGSAPTNWSIGGTGGLNYDVSVGTTYIVNGVSIPTVRVRVYGTTTNTAATNISYEANRGIAGLTYNVTKTQSIYVAVVAGTPPAPGALSGLTHWGQVLDKTGAVVFDNQNAFTPTSTFTQFSQSNTMLSSSVATSLGYLAPYTWRYAAILAYFGSSPGTVTDFTLDVGGGQLGAQTSPITPVVNPDTAGLPGVAGSGSAPSLGGGTFSRSSSATYLDTAGNLLTVGNDVLRYQSNLPFLETSTTNYLIRSSQLQTSWGPNAVTVTGNAAIAPDGTMTATLLTETTANNEHFIGQTPAIVVNVPYTFSFYAKDITRRYCMLQFYDNTAPANTSQTTYDLQSGIITFNTPNGVTIVLDAGMQAISNGWYRCWVSALLNSVANTGVLCRLRMMPSFTNAVVYTGDPSNQIYFWGAQLEQGTSAPTSFIYTTTVAATRAADMVSTAGIPVVEGTVSGVVSGVSAAGSAGITIACLDPILNLYHNSNNPNRLLNDPLASTTIAASFTVSQPLSLLEVDLFITK